MTAVHVAVARSDRLRPDPDLADPATRRLPPTRRRDVLARRVLASELLARLAPDATAVHMSGRAPVVEGPGTWFVSVTAADGTVAAAVATQPVGIDLVDLRSRALARRCPLGGSLRAIALDWGHHEAVVKYEAVAGAVAAMATEVVPVAPHLVLVVASAAGTVDLTDLTDLASDRSEPLGPTVPV